MSEEGAIIGLADEPDIAYLGKVIGVDRDVAHVPPSLREAWLQVPEAERAAVDWSSIQPDELYRDLAPAERMAALADAAGWAMADVGRVEREVREAIRAEGYRHDVLPARLAAARERAIGELDALEQRVTVQVERYEAPARQAIEHHTAALFSHPNEEGIATRRLERAWKLGPAAVTELFDGYLAVGNTVATQQLARAARTRLASVSIASDATERAMAAHVTPIADALDAHVTPAEVAAARSTIAAGEATRQKLRRYRAALGR